MKKPYAIFDGRALAELELVLAERYPDLRLTVENGRLVLKGSFPVVYEGEALDRFQIEMWIPPDFPEEVPILREVGGRIPWDADRHVFTGGLPGTSCVFVLEEWFILPKETQTIIAFLDGPVRNYFIGQSLVEQREPWPFGERTHGRQGLLESYAEMLGIEINDKTIQAYFHALSHNKVKGHWDCPCGSGKVLRRCHLQELRALQDRVSPKVAKRALARLKNTPA